METMLENIVIAIHKNICTIFTLNFNIIFALNLIETRLKKKVENLKIMRIYLEIYIYLMNSISTAVSVLYLIVSHIGRANLFTQLDTEFSSDHKNLFRGNPGLL